MTIKIGSVVYIEADPDRRMVVGSVGKLSTEVYYFDSHGTLRNANLPRDILQETTTKATRVGTEFKLTGAHFQ